MTYQETIEYLYAQLPMFQKLGKKAFKGKLDNIIALCDYLDNPQNRFPSIHIAGTNGKGSTAHILAAILQQAGYKTGIYSSPHLQSFTERIKINGVEMRQDAVVDFVAQHQSKIETTQPSFFEITVAMAFEYFATEKVDIAIIEVGLGGRLDSTNVISPVLSIITNIAYDHQDILGNSLTEIASSKAGIIKEKTAVVISEKQAETLPVFLQEAQEKQSEVYFAQENYQISVQSVHWNIFRKQHLFLEKVKPDLQGNYQVKNALGVLQAIEILQAQSWNIPLEAIRTGLAQTNLLSNFKGRWQILSQKPLTICDTAHNEAGILQVLAQLEALEKPLHVILAFVKDKDWQKILELFPKDAQYYFCQFDMVRALAVEDLWEEAKQQNFKGKVFSTVPFAYQNALENAEEEEVIFIGGSTFAVADLLKNNS